MDLFLDICVFVIVSVIVDKVIKTVVEIFLAEFVKTPNIYSMSISVCAFLCLCVRVVCVAGWSVFEEIGRMNNFTRE